MKFSRPAQLFCALAALQKVNALRLGLRGQALIPTAPLHRRSHLSGLLDSQNVQYSTNLTLNGQLISASKTYPSQMTWSRSFSFDDFSSRHRKVRGSAVQLTPEA